MIKKLDESFLEDIVEVHKDAIFPIWNSLGREYTENEISDFVMKVIQKGEVFGYFSDNKLVGVVGFEIHKDKDAGEICFLLVNSAFQGKGLGKELMDFAEDKLKMKVHKLFLEVLTKNPAVNFYKRLDYDILDKRGNKYVMEKML
ncbi:GNAT family N-acetyltransferase [Candidatus Pacearchaeota archaeon]|nr:GNAT family N-acetyltransferase [Candidatus Pacearchaeota archaeon]